MRLLSFPVVLLALVGLVPACGSNTSSNAGSGGSSAKGGSGGTGGRVGSSGGSGSGGNTGTGGSTRPAGTCTDVSTYKGSVTQQYTGTTITVAGNGNKSYYMIPTWWSLFSNETENIDGLGFTLGNPSNASSSSSGNANNPMGFPTIFVGSYKGHTTLGSNLPKRVSDLTSIPTILSTNTDTFGTSLDSNATYDVWFTASSSPLSSGANNPGSGGAYLMVWLYKPTNRFPRGTIKSGGHIVSGMHGGWDVWIDTSQQPPCVSYVSSNPQASLSFDLNDFIQDAVQNNYIITSNMYLSVVFGGFEVWSGADGLQLKQYCVNVQ